MKEQAILQTIENNREITRDTDSQFLFEYQKALLLALKELGTLDEMQYHYAEQALKEQLRTYTPKNCSYNSKNGGGATD